MIRHVTALCSVALIGAACSRDPAPDTRATAPEAPGGDTARAVDLAAATQSYKPVRFVSEIEQVRPRTVALEPPQEVVRDGRETTPFEQVQAPVQSSEVPAPVPPVDSVVESAAAPRVPSIIPRAASAPTAVEGVAHDWRVPEPGPDLGTVIGVVLRGGLVDPGHCPPRRRPPSQIPGRQPR